MTKKIDLIQKIHMIKVKSLVTHLKEVCKLTSSVDCLSDIKRTIKKIEKLNTCQNTDLLDLINFIINIAKLGASGLFMNYH